MTTAPIEVKKTLPTRAMPTMPDVWQSFRTEMDRVFDRFAGGYVFPSLRRMFETEPLFKWDSGTVLAPTMDITEDATGYKLTAELPGLTEKDVEVEVRGEVLTVKGEKKEESERTENDVHLSERSYGAFARSFTLPEGVEIGKIGATFANGVLTMSLPKKAVAMPEAKTIEVKPAAVKLEEVKKAA